MKLESKENQIYSPGLCFPVCFDEAADLLPILKLRMRSRKEMSKLFEVIVGD
jgi:hypothetical protein